MNTLDRKDSLIRLMLEMNQSTQDVELFKQIVEGATQLVPEAKVWFGKLDYETGCIHIKNENAIPTKEHPNYVGNCSTGGSLTKNRNPIECSHERTSRFETAI
jgi:hypothetical protein